MMAQGKHLRNILCVQSDAAGCPVTAAATSVDTDLSAQGCAPGRSFLFPFTLTDIFHQLLFRPQAQRIGRRRIAETQRRSEFAVLLAKADIILSLRRAPVSCTFLAAFRMVPQRNAAAKNSRSAVIQHRQLS